MVGNLNSVFFPPCILEAEGALTSLNISNGSFTSILVTAVFLLGSYLENGNALKDQN